MEVGTMATCRRTRAIDEDEGADLHNRDLLGAGEH